MAENQEQAGGQPAARRVVKEVDPKRVPKDNQTFAQAQEASDEVAEQLRRAAGGAARHDGGSAVAMPGMNGDRAFVEFQLPDGRTVTLAQPEVAVPFIVARILGCRMRPIPCP